MATVTITWDDINDNEDGFHIYRSTSPLDTANPENLPAPLDSVAAGIGSYDDTTAAADTTYYYAVAAYKGSFVNPAGEVQVDTAAASLPTVVGVGAFGELLADTAPRGAWLSDTGDQLVWPASGADEVRQRYLSTSYDLSAVASQGQVSTTDFVLSMAFNGDGTEMFYTYNPSTQSEPVIHRRPLSTPYDISTASLQDYSYLYPHASESASVAFLDAGNKILMIESTGEFEEHDCPTPYDPSGLETAPTTKTISGVPGSSRTLSGFLISVAGDRVWVLEGDWQADTSVLRQFSLSVPWDVSSATEIGSPIDLPEYTNGFPMTYVPGRQSLFVGLQKSNRIGEIPLTLQ